MPNTDEYILEIGENTCPFFILANQPLPEDWPKPKEGFSAGFCQLLPDLPHGLCTHHEPPCPGIGKYRVGKVDDGLMICKYCLGKGNHINMADAPDYRLCVCENCNGEGYVPRKG